MTQVSRSSSDTPARAAHPPGLATVLLDGAATPAVWAGGFVLPLAETAVRHGGTAPASALAALQEWEHWSAVIHRAAGDGVGGAGWLPDTQVTFLPALPDPPTLYCAATNYHDHVQEMESTKGGGVPRSPLFFLAPPAALAGHRRDVGRPPGCTRFDWEIELAVIIGREAVDVAAADAPDIIAGYTVANDLSIRDYARPAGSPFFPDWLRMKGYTGCKPLGPVIVPARDVPDPMNLELSLTVDGEQRQASSTAKMIFSIAEQIECLSRIAPLRPGDIILTGTPAGTGNASGTYLSPGDVVVAEIDGVGRLETHIVSGDQPADAQPQEQPA
jgi:2-keto-4-pentenoate hydratase/2-oxohepta-3-ene-1,7-dioic acid hydratase in catechol pathway